MNDDERSVRHSQIQAAALELLQELGYRKTSMLLIAKRARASNQTLYAWYSSKQALFRSIVEDYGRQVREHLEAGLRDPTDPLQVLREFGPKLLRYTTDGDAIIMNRAAVIDAAETGVLARAIDEVGRGAIFPNLCVLMQRLVDERVFDPGEDSSTDLAQVYVALLFGEAQFRQALGTLPALDEAEIQRRAERAFRLACRLWRLPSTAASTDAPT